MTQEQWGGVSGGNPSHLKGEKKPVETVSWHDCQEFIAKLNKSCPGLFAALPTEAQWEYACRAGQASAFNDGSECTEPDGKDPALVELAWFDENSESETHVVKGKRCNGWGLYDMHGNVWEWCRDGRRDYEEGAVDNPVGPEAAAANRVARSGAWSSVAREVFLGREGLGVAELLQTRSGWWWFTGAGWVGARDLALASGGQGGSLLPPWGWG